MKGIFFQCLIYRTFTDIIYNLITNVSSMKPADKFTKCMNDKLALKKLGIKNSPNIYAEQHGYLLLKYSVNKCKNNE